MLGYRRKTSLTPPVSTGGFILYLCMIRPQPGFQEQALSTSADIAIIGGAAGSGKTYIELLETTRNLEVKDFGFVVFRRTTTQIRNEGGLWDTSKKIYPLLGGVPKEQPLEWAFPSGAKGKFAHLEYEKNVLDWQGAQVPLIIFDELTHFTEKQFWYMVSRNRSNCGVKPYMRASCNPDPNSWVARFIEWYIDQQTGFPIKERAGKLRYFTRDGEAVVWGNSPKEVIEKCPHIFSDKALLGSGVKLEDMIKSFTFIPGTIYENKIFIKEDPTYLGTLLSLQEEEKLRLLAGNWLVSLDGLMIADPIRINSIFDNYPEQSPRPLKAIIVDAARAGRDFCVLFVFNGWEVVHTVVWKVSDVHDVLKVIEDLRRKFGIVKDMVVIDQDGVGGGLVKLGGYCGFHGGQQPMRDPETRIRENYKNLKTQCYYRLCEKRINTGEIRISISNENCIIYDDSRLNGQHSTKIKVGSQFKDIRDLIKEDLRTIKRKDEIEDGVTKIAMITKEEQKNLLGRSPDFGDTLMMREWLELKPEVKKFQRQN